MQKTIISKEQSESYEAVEAQIQKAIEHLLESEEESPNLSAVAREFNVPCQRLRAQLNGRESKMKRQAANTKLDKEQELAVCQYLDRLDMIGTSARLQMITSCANAILRDSHCDSILPAPIVGEH